jgi:hypothetical protein
MKSLRTILMALDRPASHLVYNTRTQQASLYEGDLASETPPSGTLVSLEDVLTLYQNGWITRYDSRDGGHRYRITETGRKAYQQ